MRASLRSAILLLFGSPVALAFIGCSAPRPATTSTGQSVPASISLGSVGASPFTGAAQGVAINGTQVAYVNSKDWIADYNAKWSQQWKNTNELAGLPAAVTHIGDIDYYNGRIFAPVENYATCASYTPVTLAVFDASGNLITWSDITADGHEASSVTVVPEKSQIVVSDFCGGIAGRNKIWIYDLNALLNNVPGGTLTATSSITLSQTVNSIQGISWNSTYGQYLVSVDTTAITGALWYVAANGQVNGPAYIVPESGELEGLDFSSGDVYYLINGYVYSLGPPVATPTFSIATGSYTTSQTVAITDTDPSAVIYFTLDGSIPTTASTVYSAPVAISHTQTIKAIAVATDQVNSLPAAATYTINSTP